MSPHCSASFCRHVKLLMSYIGVTQPGLLLLLVVRTLHRFRKETSPSPPGLLAPKSSPRIGWCAIPSPRLNQIQSGNCLRNNKTYMRQNIHLHHFISTTMRENQNGPLLKITISCSVLNVSSSLMLVYFINVSALAFIFSCQQDTIIPWQHSIPSPLSLPLKRCYIAVLGLDGRAFLSCISHYFSNLDSRRGTEQRWQCLKSNVFMKY